MTFLHDREKGSTFIPLPPVLSPHNVFFPHNEFWHLSWNWICHKCAHLFIKSLLHLCLCVILFPFIHDFHLFQHQVSSHTQTQALPSTRLSTACPTRWCVQIHCTGWLMISQKNPNCKHWETGCFFTTTDNCSAWPSPRVWNSPGLERLSSNLEELVWLVLEWSPAFVGMNLVPEQRGWE